MLYLQSILALSLVLGLMWILYRLVQRFGGRLPGLAKPRRIQVMERSSLGDRRSLLLVSVGGQQFLVGSTPQSLSLLAKIDQKEAGGRRQEPGRGRREEGRGIRNQESGFGKNSESDSSQPPASCLLPPSSQLPTAGCQLSTESAIRPFRDFLEEVAL